jgi:hypothetical protein
MKHFHFAGATLLALILGLSGCATVVNGKTQEVTVSSDPLGAAILVDGVNVGTTPAAVNLTRADSHQVRIEKPGYVPYEMTTVTVESGWVAADAVPFPFPFDLLLGMPLGRAADSYMGGANEIRPTDISAQLIAGAAGPVAGNAPAPPSPSHLTSDSEGNPPPIPGAQ